MCSAFVHCWLLFFFILHLLSFSSSFSFVWTCPTPRLCSSLLFMTVVFSLLFFFVGLYCEGPLWQCHVQGSRIHKGMTYTLCHVCAHMKRTSLPMLPLIPSVLFLAILSHSTACMCAGYRSKIFVLPGGCFRSALRFCLLILACRFHLSLSSLPAYPFYTLA